MTANEEHREQAALMTWAAYAAIDRPELGLLYANANGGARSPVTGARMKAEGVKAGVPDLFLPVARCGYHGLYIEMKRRKGGHVSPEQKWWLDRLNEQGFLTRVCRGYDEATRVLCDYLEGVNHD